VERTGPKAVYQNIPYVVQRHSGNPSGGGPLPGAVSDGHAVNAGSETADEPHQPALDTSAMAVLLALGCRSNFAEGSLVRVPVKQLFGSIATTPPRETPLGSQPKRLRGGGGVVDT